MTCNCDVPKIPELGACSRIVKAGTANPGANPMAWGGARDATLCGCESGTHTGLTICDQFACPNGPQLKTPTPCPLGSCVWPTNKKLGTCTSTSAVVFTGGPVRTFDYCECRHQGTAVVPMLTDCDGTHVCPNQVNHVTDYGAYNGVIDYTCTQELPSLSFWDSCVYTRDPPLGPGIEHEKDIRHACLCNIADNKGVTNTYDPVTVNCGKYLCHNSAPLQRRAVSYEQGETSTVLPLSISMGVTPLIPITTEATPGSLPTANPGPTSVPSSG